jgi:two-component system, OmpR family, sensor histidine kinase VicK
VNTIDVCGNSKFPQNFISYKTVEETIRLISQKRNLRQRFVIEITTQNLVYCKELTKIVELRHLDEIEANFAINDCEYMGSITFNEPQQAIYSNIKEVVEQQKSIFEALWKKATSAQEKIYELEQGRESQFLEVITDSKEATDVYIELSKSIQKEALVLFANSKAILRADKLGVLNNLMEASVKKGAQIKIIFPISEINSHVVKHITEKAPDIKILDGGSSHSGLLIVDNKKLLRFELKEPGAEDFTQAIGFVSYSNSKVNVYSSRSFFELLWNEYNRFEALKKSDKMKDEFINIAAHELRTPIQPILGISQVLSCKIKDKEQLELLDVILRNAKRLQRLTEDILDVTKIESQAMILKKEALNLNEIISAAIQDITNEIQKTKLGRLKVLYFPDGDIFVEADRTRITQVIWNLLTNAAKFTKEGYITVSARKKQEDPGQQNAEKYNGYVIITVKDTGCGIDSEILPKLFTKFASKSFSGTGLGLYISRSIIEAHGGKIWAANNKNEFNDKEAGATFAFMMPIITKSEQRQLTQSDMKRMDRVN